MKICVPFPIIRIHQPNQCHPCSSQKPNQRLISKRILKTNRLHPSCALRALVISWLILTTKTLKHKKTSKNYPVKCGASKIMIIMKICLPFPIIRVHQPNPCHPWSSQKTNQRLIGKRLLELNKL